MYEKLKKYIYQRLRRGMPFYGMPRKSTNEPAFDEPKTNSIKNALGYESNLSSSTFINFVHSRASC